MTSETSQQFSEHRDSDEKKSPYHHGNLPAALLQAAELELEEKGLENLSLRAIAKRVGVSHAAPAHHFGDTQGLLSALAARGFELFIDAQRAQQARTKPHPKAQLAAAGLGYIKFAAEHPALFRLMFSSKRPDFISEPLSNAAQRSFDMLVENIEAVHGKNAYQDEKAMQDVMAAWAVTHGLADLLSSGRMKYLTNLSEPDRSRILSQIIIRLVTSSPTINET